VCVSRCAACSKLPTISGVEVGCSACCSVLQCESVVVCVSRCPVSSKLPTISGVAVGCSACCSMLQCEALLQCVRLGVQYVVKAPYNISP